MKKLLFSLGFLTVFTLMAGEGPRFNVLLIIADDQNCQLGSYGNPTIKTPNLDRLASMGTRFDQAYCNYPVCNASRTSFLSGRYPDTTKVFGNGTEPRIALGKDFLFLPEYFRKQGYFTGGYGKVAHGTFASTVKWDVFYDPARGEEDDKPAIERPAKRKARAAKTATVEVPFGWQATENKDEEEPDGITARRVAKLLEEHRDKPFFIAAGFHKPHVGHIAPKKYFDMYPPEQMPLPIEPAGHAANIPAIARPPKYFPELNDLQKKSIISHYYAASTFMDAQVGVVLAAMDRLKLWDNTVVVFLGDHGWHMGEHAGFWAKMSIMDESARAPFMVYVPGFRDHSVSHRLVEFVDIFPTLVELCHLPVPEGLQGLSLLPLLREPELPWKKAVFSVVSRGGGGAAGARARGLGRGLYTEKFTYLEWPDGSMQLYDAKGDPKQFRNLAADSNYASTIAELKRTLQAGWQAARP